MWAARGSPTPGIIGPVSLKNQPLERALNCPATPQNRARAAWSKPPGYTTHTWATVQAGQGPGMGERVIGRFFGVARARHRLRNRRDALAVCSIRVAECRLPRCRAALPGDCAWSHASCE